MHLSHCDDFVGSGADFGSRLIELAPEYVYPSQCIELTAIYHHLVNTLNIREDRVIIGGDSAGSNLCCSLLLHVARPNPAIVIPSTLGKTPKRPGVREFLRPRLATCAHAPTSQAVLLFSPWLSLASPACRTTPNRTLDGITASWTECHAVNYVAPDPEVYAPAAWNPLRAFATSPVPLTSLNREGFMSLKDGLNPAGLEFLRSPYVNPVMCEDEGWLREAFPRDGKTVMEWGESLPLG